MSQNINLIQLQFLNRVATLPIINSAIGFATDTYSRIKNSNGLVNATLSRAEQSIIFVANTAKPVLDKFEKPISAADNYACQGFDKLQKTVPALNKSTDELRVETKRLIDLSVAQFGGIRQYGNSKIRDLKEYGLNKVNVALESPYVKALVRSVDTAIELTENAVDHYLPAPENEIVQQNDKTNNETTTLVRMGHLSDKMRRRLYDQLLNKWLPYIFATIGNLKSVITNWNPNSGANPPNPAQ
jgi:hypothetical protein